MPTWPSFNLAWWVQPSCYPTWRSTSHLTPPRSRPSRLSLQARQKLLGQRFKGILKVAEARIATVQGVGGQARTARGAQAPLRAAPRMVRLPVPPPPDDEEAGGVAVEGGATLAAKKGAGRPAVVALGDGGARGGLMLRRKPLAAQPASSPLPDCRALLASSAPSTPHAL